jgi:hypothetical protein
MMEEGEHGILAFFLWKILTREKAAQKASRGKNMNLFDLDDRCAVLMLC